MQADILICGGSLAGMACAIQLKQLGLDAIVLEKSHFPRPKLCGEFLTPDSLIQLRQLGILDAVFQEAYGPVETVRFYNRQGQALKIKMQWMNPNVPYGVALPRFRLDDLLMRAARNLNISVLEGHRVLSNITPNASGLTLQVETRTRLNTPMIQDYTARFVIDAAGRNGHLGRDKAKPSGEIGRRIGIQCHLETPTPIEIPELHMFLFPGGYGGLQPIGDNLMNLCLMTDATSVDTLNTTQPQSFQEYLNRTIRQNPAAHEQLRDTRPVTLIQTTAGINLDLSFNIREPDGLLRVGDSLVTVDPFTGSGMSHALASGQLAAEILHRGLQNQWTRQRISREYRQAYHHQFARRLKQLRQFRPLLESETWQRRLWPILTPALPMLTRLIR